MLSIVIPKSNLACRVDSVICLNQSEHGLKRSEIGPLNVIQEGKEGKEIGKHQFQPMGSRGS